MICVDFPASVDKAKFHDSIYFMIYFDYMSVDFYGVIASNTAPPRERCAL
jgi:hypothetical protein